MHALDQAYDTLKREFDAACSQVARAARCQITNELNQCLRRLRHYQTEGEWLSAVLDGAARFAQQAAVLTLHHDLLRLRAQYKLNLPEILSFPVSSAAAFASAIDTRDPVIALRTPSEVTEQLSAPEAGERAHIVPITNGGRVVAVLFAADQEYMDVNALEVIAGIASAVLERRSNASLHAQISAPAQTRLNGSASANSQPFLPSWTDLSEEQRSLHIQAQRFSRVSVAEMQLSRPEAYRAGREQGNLYVSLKNEIDKARETYRKDFMTIPSMVDYLHLELVHSAAEGDELILGTDYPGQLL